MQLDRVKVVLILRVMQMQQDKVVAQEAHKMEMLMHRVKVKRLLILKEMVQLKVKIILIELRKLILISLG